MKVKESGREVQVWLQRSVNVGFKVNLNNASIPPSSQFRIAMRFTVAIDDRAIARCRPLLLTHLSYPRWKDCLSTKRPALEAQASAIIPAPSPVPPPAELGGCAEPELSICNRSLCSLHANNSLCPVPNPFDPLSMSSEWSTSRGQS